jgi:hypothetical protein
VRRKSNENRDNEQGCHYRRAGREEKRAKRSSEQFGQTKLFGRVSLRQLIPLRGLARFDNSQNIEMTAKVQRLEIRCQRSAAELKTKPARGALGKWAYGLWRIADGHDGGIAIGRRPSQSLALITQS